MEQNETIKTKQQTKIAVKVAFIAAGAFVLGGFIFYSLGSKTTTTTTSTGSTTSTSAEQLKVVGIEDAMVANSPTQGADVDTIEEIDLLGNQDNPILFGKFLYDNTYIDGGSSQVELPLMIKIGTTSPGHASLILTLKREVPQASKKQSFLHFVHRAQAIQVADNICIPELIPSDNSTSYLQNSKKPLPGIKTANAQMNINGNTGSGGDITNWYTYYVSKDGNVYSDPDLETIVNAESCTSLSLRSFNPSDITNVSSSKEIFPYGQRWITLFKNWRYVLGFYNSPDGFIDYQSEPAELHSIAPLTIIISSSTEENTGQIDAQTVSVQTGAGELRNLCLPQINLDPDKYIIYFYDKDGHPYQDVFLTKRVSCGNSQDCSSVNCDKYPDHPCCLSETPQL